MKRKTKIIIAVILLGILGGTLGNYLYQNPKIPSYSFTNATGLTETEYFSNYNLPNCVADHLNSSSLELIPKYYSGFEQ